MSNIWVLTAMEAEREIVFPEKTVELVAEKPFAIRKDNASGMHVLTTGIGTVNAAMAVQYLLDHHTPDTIVNIGSAGGVSERTKLTSAYLVDEAVFFDVDVTQFGYSYGEFPYNGKRAYPLSPAPSELRNNQPIVGASGNRFVTDFQQQYRARFDRLVSLVDMELAGILHTLSINEYSGNVYAIKGVSDQADGDSTQDFNANLKKAMENVKEKLHAFI
jgi:5'-methylthioadenosine/S-adenosylhomocysteine nucleosidase